MSDDDLLIIKKSSLKRNLARIFEKFYKLWIGFQRETTTFWRRLLKNDNRLRVLAESPAIILFFNTILLSFIGNIFGGLLGQIALIVAFLNIMFFLIEKMGWIEKLKKDNKFS